MTSNTHERPPDGVIEFEFSPDVEEGRLLNVWCEIEGESGDDITEPRLGAVATLFRVWDEVDGKLVEIPESRWISNGIEGDMRCEMEEYALEISRNKEDPNA